MSFLNDFNKSGIIKTAIIEHDMQWDGTVIDNAYTVSVKPEYRSDCAFQGLLTVNGHAIEDRQNVIIDTIEVNLKDLWVNTVLNLLETNTANNKVFSDNLGLNFDHITIETKVKYASPIKPLRIVSNKVTQQKTEGWQYCFDLANVDDRESFDLSKLKSVKGYLNGKAYPLFSVIGKCEINPDAIISKIPNFKVSPSLQTISQIVQINLIGLTELSGQLNVKDVVKKHTFILTCHHKGLVTLSYGDYTYNIGVIGLHKVLSHQYVDQTSCKLAHFFNDIGVSRYANGTAILSSDNKLKIEKYNLIHDTISKHYGKKWEIVKDNQDIVIITGTNKVITLCVLIDNGLIATPSLYPIYDGILHSETVDQLLSQVSGTIGRYLKLHTSLECDKTAKVFNDKLLKTYIKCYVYTVLNLQGCNPVINFNLDVNVVRKMLPTDQFLTTNKLSDKLTQTINRYGMQATKDVILQTKKLLQNGEINPTFNTML